MYDDAHRMSQIAYYDGNDSLINNTQRYAMISYDYDENNNVIGIHYFDSNKAPVITEKGYALEVWGYNNRGFSTSCAYFGENNDPVRGKYRFHEIRLDRDDIGQDNPNGTPADQASYSTMEEEYDDIGRKETEKYYQQDELVSMRQFEYEGSSLSAKTDFSSGSEDGPREVHRYDTRGREVATVSYRQQGFNGRTVQEFDQYGNLLKKSFYNAQDELTRYFVTEFNSYGLPIRTSYYNANGQLSREANAQEHVAVAESDYATGTNVKIERRCYDEDHQPLRIVSGGKMTYARCTMEYDQSGNCIQSVFYDEQGDVYQSILQEYDEYNREWNRTYRDAKGDQLARKEVHYDSLGKATFTALYNPQDKLQASLAGVAKIIYTNDSYGYIVGQEFYGADDQPVAPYGLYHKFTRVRENERTTEIRYYGTDGQLTINPDGYAVEKFTYDDRGRETSRAFFGVEGEPILLKWQFSRYEVKYDDLGEIQKVRYFDTAGHEVQQVDGLLKISYAYINSIPKRILYFSGNDDTSLMGDLEVKIYLPMQEFVELLPCHFAQLVHCLLCFILTPGNLSPCAAMPTTATLDILPGLCYIPINFTILTGGRHLCVQTHSAFPASSPGTRGKTTPSPPA